MVDFITSLWISIGFVCYFFVFFTWDYLIKSGRATNSPNRTIAKLMTDHNVNIRTFQKNNVVSGFAWFGTIWINEKLFSKRKERLLFVFHHEHYHVMKNHKAWKLTMRFSWALLPVILLSFMHWAFFLMLFVGIAVGIEKISRWFEDEANKYAFKETSKNAKKGSSFNK